MNSRQERLMEALLEDEGLTAGLVDADAQILLDWTQQQTADLFPHNLPPEELEQRAHALRQQARVVSRIVTALQEQEGPERLQRYLNRLPPVLESPTDLLGELRSQPTPAAQIKYLLNRLEENK